jgi:hypothetical protein
MQCATMKAGQEKPAWSVWMRLAQFESCEASYFLMKMACPFKL